MVVDVKEIVVIGFGYIGLLIVIMFVNVGFRVIGYEIWEDVVRSINFGKVYIIEFEIDEFLKKVVLSGNLWVIFDFEEIRNKDVYIICV